MYVMQLTGEKDYVGVSGGVGVFQMAFVGFFEDRLGGALLLECYY